MTQLDAFPVSKHPNRINRRRETNERSSKLTFSIQTALSYPLVSLSLTGTLGVQVYVLTQSSIALTPYSSALRRSSYTMSDSDSDDFRDGADYDSGSDAYAPQLSAPVKKGAKATKSVISSKVFLGPSAESVLSLTVQASAAKKGSNAKQPLRNKENLPNDSISEDDASAVSSSHRPHKDYLRLVAEGGDAVNTNAQKKPAKDASEMYQKVGQEALSDLMSLAVPTRARLEASRLLYRLCGSGHPDDVGVQRRDEDDDTSVSVHAIQSSWNRNTTFVPGFFKIFDEILVNAADNKVSVILEIY